MEENIGENYEEIEHRLEKNYVPEIDNAYGQGHDDQGANEDKQYYVLLAQLGEKPLGQLHLWSLSGHSSPPVDADHSICPIPVSIA